MTIDVYRHTLKHTLDMIQSYRDKKTERFATGLLVSEFQGFEQQAAKRLAILNAAPSLATLRAIPSNRLEALKGRRQREYSIRINRQWQICLRGPMEHQAPNVEIVDYH